MGSCFVYVCIYTQHLQVGEERQLPAGGKSEPQGCCQGNIFQSAIFLQYLTHKLLCTFWPDC